MKKSKILISIFIIIAFIISFISNIDFKPNLYSKSDIDLIKKCYYEDLTTSFFYDNVDTYISKDISLYNTLWNIKILKTLKKEIPEDQLNELKLLFEHNKKNYYTNLNKEKNRLQYISLLVNIEKNIYSNIQNKEMYTTELLKNQGSDGLFFKENENENISEKLGATKLALSIFKEMNIKPKELEKTKNKLIQLYKEDSNFTTDSYANNIIKNGRCLILSLKDLDINLSEIDKKTLEKRKKWLLFWGCQVENILNSDQANSLSTHFTMITLKEMSEYLDVKLNINVDNYIKYLNNSINNVLIDDNSDIDPQILYYHVKTLDLLHIKIPKEKLYRNIISKYNQGWRYNNHRFNIIENYYGLVIANQLKVDYNKQKMINKLEDSVYKRDLNLKELYFYIKTLEELNVFNKYNSEIIKVVDEIKLDSLKSSKEISDSMKFEYMYYFVKIYTDINKTNKTNENIDIIKTYITSNSQKYMQNNESTYKYIYMCDKLNINYNKLEIQDKINSLYSPTQGGFIHKKNFKYANIYSTADMIELNEIIQSDFVKTNKNNIMNFVNSLHGIKGGYFFIKPNSKNDISDYEECFTIKSFYDGLRIINMINNSSKR